MTMTDLARVYLYHDGTKHSFNQFARALGYLDWASQPRPFRTYSGAPQFSFRQPQSDSPGFEAVSYDQLFDPAAVPPHPITAAAIGDMMRYALGLSAWKVLGASRWALRVNPSSGNLHPTEAYVIAGPIDGLSAESGVWHYAPESHALEQRCAFAGDQWPLQARADEAQTFFVALTSIHWRESWKYGERAFRYCQHDLGHAIAALSLAAALHGWRLVLEPEYSQDSIAALIGIDRDDDYVDAEREDAGCLLRISATTVSTPVGCDISLVESARRGRWLGRASQLSEDHVQWSFIDEVADATRDPGCRHTGRPDGAITRAADPAPLDRIPRSSGAASHNARRLLLQRRSAVALDGLSSIDRPSFCRMLSALLPGTGPPWNALWWTPRIHLVLFVHRVDGLEPGLYVLARDGAALSRLQAAFDQTFEWMPIDDHLPLFRLSAGMFRTRSQRLSCDQAIAADGFFSLAMIADFDRSLTEHGPSFYRRLFWESGVVGQMLYLEAEEAGARGTGIGCFYDDPVHDTLGLTGHTFQSLYHFTVGMPVEDRRITAEPGYHWEE